MHDTICVCVYEIEHTQREKWWLVHASSETYTHREKETRIGRERSQSERAHDRCATPTASRAEKRQQNNALDDERRRSTHTDRTQRKPDATPQASQRIA